MKISASNRLPSNMIMRDLKKEAHYGIKNISFYAYTGYDTSFKVVGQVFAGSSIKKGFCLIINIYDQDGDIMVSEESSSYGDGLVTSMIMPGAYFDGFPFKFCCYDIKWDEVSRIEIIPADSY